MACRVPQLEALEVTWTYAGHILEAKDDEVARAMRTICLAHA